MEAKEHAELELDKDQNLINDIITIAKLLPLFSLLFRFAFVPNLIILRLSYCSRFRAKSFFFSRCFSHSTSKLHVVSRHHRDDDAAR